MAISVNYLPLTDIKRDFWLRSFYTKLTTYAAVLDIEPSVLQQVQIDAEAFHAVVLYTEKVRNYSEAVTTFRNLLRNGSTSLGTLPNPPEAITLPAGMKRDIFGRIRRLVRNIKSHPNYSESIGDELQIIAPKSAEDINTWKPRLSVAFNAGIPIIKWKKGKSQGIKLKADYGSGNFEFIGVSTIPDFTDHHPLPPAGQSAVWRYAAIYLLKDQEAGQYSDIIAVTVTGVN